jgi:hypothetical protein
MDLTGFYSYIFASMPASLGEEQISFTLSVNLFGASRNSKFETEMCFSKVKGRGYLKISQLHATAITNPASNAMQIRYWLFDSEQPFDVPCFTLKDEL